MQVPDCLSRCVLGTAGLGGIWGKIDNEESIKAILIALKSGITCIDSAPAYGDAESFVDAADYLGRKRNSANSSLGPFEIQTSGKQKIKVW